MSKTNTSQPFFRKRTELKKKKSWNIEKICIKVIENLWIKNSYGIVAHYFDYTTYDPIGNT